MHATPICNFKATSSALQMRVASHILTGRFKYVLFFPDHRAYHCLIIDAFS